MEPGEIACAAFTRVAPLALYARPWAELDNDGRCFWQRLEAAIEHDRVAAQLAGPPRRFIRDLPVEPALVVETETMRICRRCNQRLGELHILTCPNRRKNL